MNAANSSKWLSLSAADRYMGLRSGTVAKAANAGELPAVRIGRRTRRVCVNDLDVWMRSKTVKPRFQSFNEPGTGLSQAKR